MSYLGFDVLEINPNRLGPIEDRHRRKFALLDGETGKRTADEHSPVPSPGRPFTWTAFDRAEIAALRAFLAARKGRAVPFWLPSYQWDLTLSEDVLEDQASISVNWVRYVEQMWGTTGARRHVALFELAQLSQDYYRISDADDPGTHLTESLTIDPVAVRDYPAATTVISFLKLCRLEDDGVEIEHFDGKTAQATINVRELPQEAPL